MPVVDAADGGLVPGASGVGKDLGRNRPTCCGSLTSVVGLPIMDDCRSAKHLDGPGAGVVPVVAQDRGDGRCGDVRGRSRRDRPPPRRRQVHQAGGITGGACRARSAGIDRCTGAAGDDGSAGRRAARPAVARVDAGHVRPPGPLPAGAVPSGGVAVQAPRFLDRWRDHARRWRRDRHQSNRRMDSHT